MFCLRSLFKRESLSKDIFCSNFNITLICSPWLTSMETQKGLVVDFEIRIILFV